MNLITNAYGIPRLLRGRVVKSPAGELLLKTPEGSFPVKLEGRPIPLGEEFAFKFLRQEPGRVILTPLSSWEYWQEALPFLKELPGADREGEAGSRCRARLAPGQRGIIFHPPLVLDGGKGLGR